MGKEYIDENGDRPLFFDNEKKAGLNGVSGKEYLVYNDSELYNPNLIKEYKSKSQLINDWNDAHK